LAVEISSANLNDCKMLAPVLDLVPAVRGRVGRPRRRPVKLHGDKGYDHAFCRDACRQRGIIPRIARRGIEPRSRLGRYRWVVERTIAWLHLFRRLAVRYERRADIHLAFLTMGAALVCFNIGRFC
jgi:IS5 family transposase